MKIAKYIIPTLTGIALSATLTAVIAGPKAMNIASLIKDNGDNALAASKLTYMEERTSPNLYTFKRDKLALQQQAITNQLLAGILITLKQLQLDHYRTMNHVVPMTKLKPTYPVYRKVPIEAYDKLAYRTDDLATSKHSHSQMKNKSNQHTAS